MAAYPYRRHNDFTTWRSGTTRTLWETKRPRNSTLSTPEGTVSEELYLADRDLSGVCRYVCWVEGGTYSLLYFHTASHGGFVRSVVVFRTSCVMVPRIHTVPPQEGDFERRRVAMVAITHTVRPSCADAELHPRPLLTQGTRAGSLNPDHRIYEMPLLFFVLMTKTVRSTMLP